MDQRLFKVIHYQINLNAEFQHHEWEKTNSTEESIPDMYITTENQASCLNENGLVFVLLARLNRQAPGDTSRKNFLLIYAPTLVNSVIFLLQSLATSDRIKRRFNRKSNANTIQTNHDDQLLINAEFFLNKEENPDSQRIGIKSSNSHSIPANQVEDTWRQAMGQEAKPRPVKKIKPIPSIYDVARQRIQGLSGVSLSSFAISQLYEGMDIANIKQNSHLQPHKPNKDGSKFVIDATNVSQRRMEEELKFAEMGRSLHLWDSNPQMFQNRIEMADFTNRIQNQIPDDDDLRYTLPRLAATLTDGSWSIRMNSLEPEPQNVNAFMGLDSVQVFTKDTNLFQLPQDQHLHDEYTDSDSLRNISNIERNGLKNLCSKLITTVLSNNDTAARTMFTKQQFFWDQHQSPTHEPFHERGNQDWILMPTGQTLEPIRVMVRIPSIKVTQQARILLWNSLLLVTQQLLRGTFVDEIGVIQTPQNATELICSGLDNDYIDKDSGARYHFTVPGTMLVTLMAIGLASSRYPHEMHLSVETYGQKRQMYGESCFPLSKICNRNDPQRIGTEQMDLESDDAKLVIENTMEQLHQKAKNGMGMVIANIGKILLQDPAYTFGIGTSFTSPSSFCVVEESKQEVVAKIFQEQQATTLTDLYRESNLNNLLTPLYRTNAWRKTDLYPILGLGSLPMYVIPCTTRYSQNNRFDQPNAPEILRSQVYCPNAYLLKKHLSDDVSELALDKIIAKHDPLSDSVVVHFDLYSKRVEKLSTELARCFEAMGRDGVAGRVEYTMIVDYVTKGDDLFSTNIMRQAIITSLERSVPRLRHYVSRDVMKHVSDIVKLRATIAQGAMCILSLNNLSSDLLTEAADALRQFSLWIDIFLHGKKFNQQNVYLGELSVLIGRPFLTPMSKEFLGYCGLDPELYKSIFDTTGAIPIPEHIHCKELKYTLSSTKRKKPMVSHGPKTLDQDHVNQMNSIASVCMACVQVFNDFRSTSTHNAVEHNKESKYCVMLQSPAATSWFNTELHKLSPEQNNVFQAVAYNKERIFLSGYAGTGKSFLTRLLIIQLCRQYGVPHVVVAATSNLAASIIGGKTINSILGGTFELEKTDVEEMVYRIKRSTTSLETIQNMKVLIIDEIGTMVGDVFSRMMQAICTIRAEADIDTLPQLFLIGDFCQLSPFVKNGLQVKHLYCFTTPEWQRLLHSVYFLRIPKRSVDPILDDVLLKARQNRPDGIGAALAKFGSALKDDPQPFTTLCSNHAIRTQINKRVLDSLTIRPIYLPDGRQTWEVQSYPEYFSRSENDMYTRISNIDITVREQIEKDMRSKLENPLRIRIGCVVAITRKIASVDDAEHIFPKGTMGYIEKVKFGLRNNITCPIEIFVSIPVATGTNAMVQIGCQMFDFKVQGETYIVEQFPLLTAYALTIHSVQGMTMPKYRIDCASFFATNQLYVALSRGTDSKRVELINIPQKDTDIVRCDPRVLFFDKYHETCTVPLKYDQETLEPLTDQDPDYTLCLSVVHAILPNANPRPSRDEIEKQPREDLDFNKLASYNCHCGTCQDCTRRMSSSRKQKNNRLTLTRSSDEESDN